MNGVHDTRGEALQLLQEELSGRLDRMDDNDLCELLTPSLVERVFDLAWTHQFDADRGPFQREVREVVQSEVDRVVAE